MQSLTLHSTPESWKKKAERDAKYAKAAEAAREKHEKERADKVKVYEEHAQKYYEEHKAALQKVIDDKRKAKSEGKIYVEAEPKVALLIRTKGIHKIDPCRKKILQLFRLRQINNAMLVKLNKATINMIKKIEPYITWGYPTRSTISKLIYKRGYARIDGSRIPLSDNEIIEGQLGKHGIICIEDLINELATVGPHFKEANLFLWPFKLDQPNKGWENKPKPYQQGGTWGRRDEKINELALKMI